MLLDVENYVKIAWRTAINARRPFAAKSNLGVIVDPRGHFDLERACLLDLLATIADRAGIGDRLTGTIARRARGHIDE